MYNHVCIHNTYNIINLFVAQAAYDMSYMNVRPSIPLIFPRPLVQLILTGWALSPEVRFSSTVELVTNVIQGISFILPCTGYRARNVHINRYSLIPIFLEQIDKIWEQDVNRFLRIITYIRDLTVHWMNKKV